MTTEQELEQPTWGAALTNAGDPAVAAGKAHALVAWVDNRGPYAARVSAKGAVLDQAGIALPGRAAAAAARPAVGFDGSNHLVVWEAPCGTKVGETCLRATRISDGGLVLDPQGIAVSPAGELAIQPAVGFDGTNFFVVWAGGVMGKPGMKIRGARLTPGGTVLDSTGITIATGDWRPAVAFNGSLFLVVWQTSLAAADVYGARVTSAGNVLDAIPIPIGVASGFQGVPAVANLGQTFFVVWQDARGASPDVYGARVSEAGAVVDSQGIVICGASGPQGWPAVAPNELGSGLLVTWIDHRAGDLWDIRGARVSADGLVLDADGALTVAGASPKPTEPHPAVDRIGTVPLVVYSNGQRLSGKRLPVDAIHSDEPSFPVATCANPQTNPSIARSPQGYLAVWQDERDVDAENGSSIYGTRLGPKGELLGAAPVLIHKGPGAHVSPKAVWDGHNFGVTWLTRVGSSNLVRYTRVSAEGKVIGAASQICKPSCLPPAIASDGNRSLIAWSRNESSGLPPTTRPLYLSQLDDEGRVVGEPTRISGTEGLTNNGALAYDGAGQFLLVWVHSDLSRARLQAARVRIDGTLLDPQAFPIATPSGGDQLVPSLAVGKDGFAVVWDEMWIEGATVRQRVMLARLARDGKVLDAEGLAIGEPGHDGSNPSIASIGVDYLVSCHDIWGGPVTHPESHRDVRLLRVTGGGAIPDRLGQILFDSGSTPSQVALSQSAPGEPGLVLYHRLTAERGAPRIFLRQASLETTPRSDAGVADTGVAGDSATAAPNTSGCGCGHAPGSRLANGTLLLLLLGLWGAVRGSVRRPR